MAVTLHDSYMRPRQGRGQESGPAADAAGRRAAWRRATPGPLVIRVERYAFERVDGPGGKSFDRAVGVYGESTVSGEKVCLRLSTDEEERQDGGPGVSRMRRPINAIRMGAGEQTVRGRFGELKFPERLDPEKRFLFRCDRVVPLRERGHELVTPDGYTRMRASWITPVCDYRDKAGNTVDMLGHVETDSWSTVNVGFSGAREDGAPNYYTAFLEAARAAVDGGARSIGRVSRQAAAAVVDLWTDRQEAAPGEAFGRLSVTTWRPDACVRVESVQDGRALAAARQTLASWFADTRFVPGEGIDTTGEPVPLHAPATPDLIVRLLNEAGEVCGFMRVIDHLAASTARTISRRISRARRDSGYISWRVTEGCGEALWMLGGNLNALLSLEGDWVDAHRSTLAAVLLKLDAAAAATALAGTKPADIGPVLPRLPVAHAAAIIAALGPWCAARFLAHADDPEWIDEVLSASGDTGGAIEKRLDETGELFYVCPRRAVAAVDKNKVLG